MNTHIAHGDCLDVLKIIPDASITAIVTDPPYALEFMGKGWDKVLPSVDIWRECLRVLKPGGVLLAFGGTRTFHRLTCAIEDAGFEIRDCLSWLYGSGFPKSLNIAKALAVKGEGNASWSGYGTALKPAWEPIVLAMKPTDGTFAANALAHGVAGINVDGCRVGPGHNGGRGREGEESANRRYTDRGVVNIAAMPGPRGGDPSGRWPTNVAHDGSDEATAGLGDAARFFYCAKASKKDRGEGNTHPTVKPTELMRWLVRMVKMPSGTLILDPFAGSGSTGVACVLEDVDFIGIEREAEYVQIARRRIEGAA